MTEGANVAIVRDILAAWGEGDFAAVRTLLDPAIAFETFMPDATESVVSRGSGEMEDFTRSWLAQWRRYRIVGEELEEVGPDKVFASVRQIAQGRQGGVEVESPGFAVWTLRDGNVVKLSLHYDRDEALEAAGLKA